MRHTFGLFCHLLNITTLKRPESLLDVLSVTVLLVCPDRPPDVSVSSAHGLLFVVGAMCSQVYCLSPPILLPNHCLSCVTLVCLSVYPPGVCSPVLIRCLTSCVFNVCLFCHSLPAFPLRVFFVYLCFILLLKPILLHMSPRLISLLSHPDIEDLKF